MQKRALVTGASGLLGRAIYRNLKNDPDWNVTGLAFSRACGDLLKVDLTIQSEITSVFKKIKPDIIIHSAAERKPDMVEKKQKETELLNVDATRFLCLAAAEAEVGLLYMSTDYVFDGKSPPYKETDQTNPLNKYGQSKLEGEKVALEISEDNLILRVPILYGPVESPDESAVTILYDKICVTSKECLMSDYERRYPTHVDDVAEVIKQLANKKLQDKSLKGIFHWSDDQNLTKYDMAVAIANGMDLPTDHIKADKTPSSGATRPYDAHLDSGRVEGLGICARRPFNNAVRECLKPFVL